jgi:two-component system response regulator RegA
MDGHVSVLVIDADLGASACLSSGLGRLGLTVAVARSLREGVRALRSDPPAAIVTEQVLPDGCVLSLLPKLGELAPGAKTMILTRHASVSAAVLAMRVGFAGYLSKPADAVEVATELGLRASTKSPSSPRGQDSVMTLDQIEWEHISRVVLRCGGNVSEAARRLQLHRRTLQRKLARGSPRRAQIAALTAH